MCNQWIADANPATPGDYTYYHYDTQGRLTHKIFDTGDLVATDYWGTTQAKHYDYFFSASGTWQKTIEYYANGTTMHYQWIADPDPANTGDVVFEAYDTESNCVFRTFDDGSIWTPGSLVNKVTSFTAQNTEVAAVIDINLKQNGLYNTEDIVISPQMASEVEDKDKFHSGDLALT
jgi:hypothetical protein